MLKILDMLFVGTCQVRAEGATGGSLVRRKKLATVWEKEARFPSELGLVG